MVHRRMRQLSLTETDTFVNLAKHALETLNASEEEDPDSKDGVPPHYSDEANAADDHDDHNGGGGVSGSHAAAVVATGVFLKPIHSEPMFKKKRKKRLQGLGQTEEMAEEIELESRWQGSADVAGDDDMLHFVARSSSDIELESGEHRDDSDEPPSGDETTHLAAASNLLLC